LLKEWTHGGHPFGCLSARDHFIYACDASAGRILEIDRDGKIVGSFELPAGSGRHLDAHEIAVDKDLSIYTAEVMNWRALKLRLRSK